MPFLNGFLVISEDTPSFVLPVFIDRPGGNQSLIQQIGTNDRVTSFLEIDAGNSYEHTYSRNEINVGDQALWGFRSFTGAIDVGTSIKLQRSLKLKLRKGAYRKYPLIESQIAQFCKNSALYKSALSNSYQLLQKGSPLMAGIWRDLTVLLPPAKRELAKVVPVTLHIDVDRVQLRASQTNIELRLPSSLYDFFESRSTRPNLTETVSIGNAFGLRTFTLLRSDAGPIPVDTFDDVYGEIVPFTGIGDLVAKNSPSYSRIRRVIPPWIKKATRPARSQPLVSFYIFNTEPRTIERALQFAKVSGADRIKIAIITSPITFGTAKGTKPDLTKLESLKADFDYIFIVGNHVLQKPTGIAPRLAASSRAAKYVRACIDGIMQIVWSSDGPKTAKSFYAIFAKVGFCLVGRSEITSRRSPIELLSEAIDTAASERLPLYASQRIVAVGPSSVVNQSQVASYLNRTADTILREVISVESIGQRRAATVLAFGIKPVEQSARRLREFCLELLRCKNFSISRETAAAVYGTFPKSLEIAISFATFDQTASAVFAIERTKVRRRAILTNFSPSASLSKHCKTRRIAIFHYSLLDEYLVGKRI